MFVNSYLFFWNLEFILFVQNRVITDYLSWESSGTYLFVQTMKIIVDLYSDG